MKKILNTAFVIGLITASTAAVAQRDHSSGDRSGRNNGASQQRSNVNTQRNNFPQQQRSFTPQQNSGTQRNFNQQREVNAQRNLSNNRSFTPQQNSSNERNLNQQRDFNSQRGISSNRNFTPQRNNTPQRSFTPQRNYGTQNRVIVQNNYYGSRNYIPRSHWSTGYNYGYSYHRFTPVGTYHFSIRPRIVISIGGPFSHITFGGSPYNYYNGNWYQPYGSSFQIIAPPIGIGISTLPIGYSPVYGPWGTYYYYNNVFYNRPDNNQEYQVVDAPLGAQVAELPKGAEVRVIDAKKYYELDGVFYQEDLRDGQIWYTVVGKNGVLSTDDGLADEPTDNLSNGDRVSILPDGSKQVTINGQQLYMSPNGNYYQQVIDGNNTWYEVVGK